MEKMLTKYINKAADKIIEPGSITDPYYPDFTLELRTTVSGQEAVMPLGVLDNNTIDWGDGTIETPSATYPSHIYTDAGTYIVKITGNINNFAFANNAAYHPELVYKLLSWGKGTFNTMSNMFYGCMNLYQVPTTCQASFVYNIDMRSSFRYTAITYINTGILNIYPRWVDSMFQNGIGGSRYNLTNLVRDNTISVSSLFAANNKITTIDGIETWDTSSVTSFSRFAFLARNLDADVSSCDVTALTTADLMFNSSSFSNENYDKLLLSWSQQTVVSGVVFDAGDAKYTEAAARQALIDAGWTINDGGPA